MSELDKMIADPVEEPIPPLVKFYKDRMVAGDVVKVELYQPDSGPGLSRTELVIHRWTGNQQHAPQQIPWDDEVNNGLIDLRVRAVDVPNESARFTLVLRAALKKIERKYGDGYLNIVLVNLIDESDLSKSGLIAEVRQYVHVNTTNRSREAYSECRDAIAREIGVRAAQLRDKLGYGPDEVKSVMTSVLATYLDERFSVSSRRQLGLL
jgi:hypothetical protein